MSPGAFIIVDLLGGIALLLWGVRMVRTGILRAWGEPLSRLIEQNLDHRLLAAGTGLIVTLFVQSGTATALILTGLAGSVQIAGVSGLSLLLGADVGSAIIAAIFASTGTSLSAWISPILLFMGYGFFTFTQEFRARNAGRILLGLGLVFLALRLIVTASAPLRDASLFHLLLTSLAGEPLLAFLIAAGVTWLSYSSLSVILLVASFVASGSLAPEGAAAMILGVNLGAGLPALSASRSLPPEIRRMPMANFVSRGLVAILLLGFTQPVSAFIAQYVQSAVGQVTTFHILFNLVVLSLGLIFAAPLMQVMERLLPEKEVPEDGLQKPRYLDRGALHTPAVALANAAQETVRMAEILDRMLHLAMEALKHSSLERLKGVRQTDEMINSYHREIHGYLSDLSQADIDSSEGRHALEIMLYVSNLEHAGDLIELSLADRIKAKVKENIEFTPDERTSLQALSAIVSASLKLACGVIASNDLGGARRLISQKDKFRIIENKILDAHFREPQQKVAKNLRRRALFVDMVRDLHTIHSHITSAAYPIVDAAGLLRDSRLRNSKKI